MMRSLTDTRSPRAAGPGRAPGAGFCGPSSGPHLVPLRWYPVLLVALLTLLVVAVMLAVSIGTVSLPVPVVWRSIVNHLTGTPAADATVEDMIVWRLRLPRALLAVVVGAGLSVAGTALQACVRNPLADPYILGVSQGAALGAVVVLVLGTGTLGGLGLSAAAFAGAMAATMAVFVLGRRGGRFSPGRLVLAGVALGYLCFSATSYLELHTNPENLSNVVFWLLGSVSGARWPDLGLPTVIVLVTTAWLMLQGRRLNTLLVGDESASALGVAVSRFRLNCWSSPRCSPAPW